MPDVTIRWRVEGANRVSNELRHWAAKLPHVLDDTIRDFSRERASYLRGKPYPPERPAQTYRRTGELGRRWRFKKVAAALYEILNLVEYAGWVVDEFFQAWMHRGRWWIFQEQVRPAPDLTKKLTAALEGLIK